MAQISIGQSSKMCHRLGTSLNAGVDIMGVLNREATHGTSAYRRHMTHVAEMVGKGTSLAEAMRDCGRYFPPLVCELVDVGEQTGRLESVLLRMADHYQHMRSLRRVFLLGILWPSLQLIVAILIIGLLIFLLGALGSSVEVFGLSGTRGVVIYAAVVLTAFAVVALAARGLLRGWFGPWPGQLIMRIPGGGQLDQDHGDGAAGLDLVTGAGRGHRRGAAMRMALQSTQNAYFTRHMDAAEAVIVRGGQFHEALQKTGTFTHDFLTSLQNAELSGTESESLSRLSEDYQRQAETATTALAVAASMLIWGLVGALLVYASFTCSSICT